MHNNNLPVISKRIWGMVRLVYMMLRKGIISKRKLLVDLNMMMKRGKIAGKAISNLMFHHHFNASSSSSSSSASSKEYEFSCSNTPNYFPFHLNKRRHNHNHHSHFFACAQPPQTHDDDVATANALKAALEILNNHDVGSTVEDSPGLPGLGKSPMVVRQLRISDSPFPLRDVEENTQVDEAAEEFIKRFYEDLRLQKN